MARHLQAHGELKVSEDTLRKLERISVSSLRRRLPASQQVAQRIAHRQGKPAPTSGLRVLIPMRRMDWDEHDPGHFEVDLVHHSGLSTEGQYVHTLQMVDVATGWSECVAVLGRSYLVMQDGFERILARLPFPVREIHPDNGAEFFNAHLLRFWREKTSVILSRSRPYHKNDNRFVEENNFSLVRAYVGYGRLDTVEQTRWLNELYNKLWLYHNFFQPVLRLKEKRILAADDHHPARLRRVYDDARTPFDRLCHLQAISSNKQAELQALRQATNPLTLHQEIQTLIDYLSALPCAPQGVNEDVHLTLDEKALPLA